MKTKLLLSFTLVLIAAGLFGMGTQAALYVGAEDLGEGINAWSKECAGKTDANCSRNLAALRKKAFKLAEFAQSEGDDPVHVDNVPDPVEGDGVDYETGKVNGWRANWRVVARLVQYHGECLNRYDTPQCKTKWAAFKKEEERVRHLYGPDGRFDGFPNAFKRRTFGPYVPTHVGREMASHWYPMQIADGTTVEVPSENGDATSNRSHYAPNPGLPPDCVELAPEVKPPDGGYYKSPPAFRPRNIPASFILVKVYQRGAFLGFGYMDKSDVKRLHMAKAQTAP